MHSGDDSSFPTCNPPLGVVRGQTSHGQSSCPQPRDRLLRKRFFAETPECCGRSSTAKDRERQWSQFSLAALFHNTICPSATHLLCFTYFSRFFVCLSSNFLKASKKCRAGWAVPGCSGGFGG